MIASSALLVCVVGLWEVGWWLRRRARRGSVFATALDDARHQGKPLVVIGAPDGGVTSGYDCGDVTIDLIEQSVCERYLRADVTKRLPFEDDSVVVFVSCVLEYVDDYEAARREIRRVGGNSVYIVRVEPWTIAAYLYPGARRTIPEEPLTRHAQERTRTSGSPITLRRSTVLAERKTP